MYSLLHKLGESVNFFKVGYRSENINNICFLDSFRGVSLLKNDVNFLFIDILFFHNSLGDLDNEEDRLPDYVSDLFADSFG